MLHKLSIAGALVILAGTGLFHRSWTDHARSAPAVKAAAQKVASIPMAIGSWRGQDLELDATEMARVGYVGACWRRYEDTSSGKVVSMLLVCGLPGPVSVHTPDVCYAGAGFEMSSDPKRVTLHPGSADAEFWKAEFTKPKDLVRSKLRIYYTWTDGQAWKAVENPRLSFSDAPVLYKLYVVCEVSNVSDANDAAREFILQLVPELDKVLQEPDATREK
jgi:hypothetical protein